MIDYKPLYQRLIENQAEAWVAQLKAEIKLAFDTCQHGDLDKWQKTLQRLPKIEPIQRHLDRAAVQIGGTDTIEEAQRNLLSDQLMQLHPWRKGPYQIHGINIDSEWRSDFKWDRIQDQIAPLDNRLVLDVGCGNGYHCWRMLGAGAGMVVGIDPTLLNVMQFQAVRHFYGSAPVYVLPIGIENIPSKLRLFDSIFSMGVLYHRRSPIDHLIELRDCLRPGGELILETLVIDGAANQVLVPEGRYAKMRNVWFIPSYCTLMSWMKRCGLQKIKLLDVTKTTSDEQRTTEWMQFHSLKDFLALDDPSLTIEGYPAPLRAIFTAEAK